VNVSGSYIRKQNWINYLIVYIVYAMGGIYFFYLKPPPKIFFFVLLFSVALYRRIRLNDYKILILILVVIFIFFAQKSISGYGTLSNLLGWVIPILNAYLVIKILKNTFFNYFVNVVYVFAIIGLFFWIMQNVFPAFNEGIPDLVKKLGTDPSDYKESLILFAYEPNKAFGNLLIRNNGGFWEPGAYVTTLVPALFFSYLINGFKSNKTKIILLAIITTFSTAGYCALFLILAYSIILSKLNLATKNLLFSLFIFLSAFSYYSFDFLNKKISVELKTANEANLSTATAGRFLGFRKALYSVSQNPFIGKDFVTKKLPAEEIDYWAPDFVGYGWMDLMAKIGLLFFAWYLVINYKFYKWFVKINSRKKYYGILALLPFLAQYILLFGQALYAVPLYLIFIVLVLIRSSGYFNLKLYNGKNIVYNKLN
jgi:hypothetical protein